MSNASEAVADRRVPRMPMPPEERQDAAQREPIAEEELTPEDERLLGGMDAEGEEDAPPPKDEIPDWATMPPDLKVPPGRQMYFVRLRGAWTDRPDKGDRQCVLWSLTEGDEKLALRRTRGDAMRAADELAKQTIRAIDGRRVDWTGRDPSADLGVFWNEIGTKCRQLIKSHYAKTHMLDAAETADFFANCIAVRTAQR